MNKRYRSFLKFLAYRRKLSSYEKFASRIGYMGAGLLIAAQWTIEPLLYIVGFICILVQVIIRKQWNLVALNINGLAAWLKHFLFILVFLLVSCKEPQHLTQPLNYKDYQSSIDTTFNYLEDIKDWIRFQK